MRNRSIILILLCMAGGLLFADEQFVTMTLKNGSVLKGKVISQNELSIIFDLGFAVVRVPRNELAAEPQIPVPGHVKSQGDNLKGSGTEAVKLSEPSTGADKEVAGDGNAENLAGSGPMAAQTVHRTPPLRPRVTQVRPAILQEQPTGVSNAGVVGVDAHFSEFGDYLQELIDIVQIQWDRILASSGVAPKPATHVLVSFRLNSKGEIAEIIKVEGDAGEHGMNAALSAIRERAPYRTWTQKMVAVLGNDQVITFTFYYW